MIKHIIFTALLFVAFVNSEAQSSDKYGLKSVTVLVDDDKCNSDVTNPDSLVFCDWLCGIRECRDEFCWLTLYTQYNRIYQGVAIHAIGPHNYWIKEVTVYDDNWNVIDNHYDSIVDMETLLNVGMYRSMKFLTKSNRLSIISLADGSIIQDSIGYKYRKPENKHHRLEQKLDCK